MRFIYTLVFYLSLPFILFRLWRRSKSAPAYAKRWRERFGWVPRLHTDKNVIWFHTVSVGEFLAALPLIRQLLDNPALSLVITTTTPTGSERVKAALGDRVYHVYAPYDLPDALSRFIRRVRPSLYLVMETELWPNTLAACQRHGIPSVLINGRLSARSARGYGKFSALTRPMLSHLTKALIQQHADAQRFIALGLPAERAEVTGNIKFDIEISDVLRAKAQSLKEALSANGKAVVFIAASTHQGEDEIILSAFASARARLDDATKLRLVLVPRHPERFEQVTLLSRERGFNTLKRTQQDDRADFDVYIGDTMGELMMLFGASDIAFVGGSLVPNGGHNLIEPAAWGLPLLTGEHVFNFAEVTQLLFDGDALRYVANDDALADALVAWVDSPIVRAEMGARALAVADANRGALQKTLRQLEAFIP